MPLMNSFYKRHRDSIQWHYRCFDRILLNGLIQPFQQPERVVGFFNTYRQLYPVSRHTLRDRNQRSWNRMSVVYCTMPGLVSKGLGCDGWTLRLRDRPIRGSTSRVISPTAISPTSPPGVRQGLRLRPRSASRAIAGRSRIASRQPKTSSGSTTTNPDPGTAGIVTSRSSCSASP